MRERAYRANSTAVRSQAALRYALQAPRRRRRSGSSTRATRRAWLSPPTGDRASRRASARTDAQLNGRAPQPHAGGPRAHRGLRQQQLRIRAGAARASLRLDVRVAHLLRRQLRERLLLGAACDSLLLVRVAGFCDERPQRGQRQAKERNVAKACAPCSRGDCLRSLARRRRRGGRHTSGQETPAGAPALRRLVRPLTSRCARAAEPLQLTYPTTKPLPSAQDCADK